MVKLNPTALLCAFIGNWGYYAQYLSYVTCIVDEVLLKDILV